MLPININFGKEYKTQKSFDVPLSNILIRGAKSSGKSSALHHALVDLITYNANIVRIYYTDLADKNMLINDFCSTSIFGVPKVKLREIVETAHSKIVERCANNVNCDWEPSKDEPIIIYAVDNVIDFMSVDEVKLQFILDNGADYGVYLIVAGPIFDSRDRYIQMFDCLLTCVASSALSSLNAKLRRDDGVYIYPERGTEALYFLPYTSTSNLKSAR